MLESASHQLFSNWPRWFNWDWAGLVFNLNPQHFIFVGWQVFDRVAKLFETVCTRALLNSAELQTSRVADDMNHRIMHFGAGSGKSSTRRAIDLLTVSELRDKDCVLLQDLFARARLPVVRMQCGTYACRHVMIVLKAIPTPTLFWRAKFIYTQTHIVCKVFLFGGLNLLCRQGVPFDLRSDFKAVFPMTRTPVSNVLMLDGFSDGLVEISRHIARYCCTF